MGALTDVNAIANAVQNPSVGSALSAASGSANLYNIGAKDLGGTTLPSDVTGALGAASGAASSILGIVNAINNPDNPGADANAAVDAYGLGSAGVAAAGAYTAAAAAGTDAAAAGIGAFSSSLASTGPYGALAAIAADVTANNVNLAGIHPGSSGAGMSSAEEQALGLTQGTLNGQGDISSDGIAYEYGNQTTSGSDSFHVYDPTTGTYGASIGVPQSNTIVDMAKAANTYATLDTGDGSEMIPTDAATAAQNSDPDWQTDGNQAAQQTISASDLYGSEYQTALAGLNKSYGSASEWGGLSQSAWDQAIMNLSSNIDLPASTT